MKTSFNLDWEKSQFFGSDAHGTVQKLRNKFKGEDLIMGSIFKYIIIADLTKGLENSNKISKNRKASMKSILLFRSNKNFTNKGWKLLSSAVKKLATLSTINLCLCR